MTHTIEFLNADLTSTVSIFCKHLREHAYTDEDEELSTLLLLAKKQMLVDEMGIILGHYKNLIKALELYIAGQEFNQYADEEKPETLWQYCLYYFERAECPLGQATEELANWFKEYAERQLLMDKAFDTMFAGVGMSIVEPNLDNNPQMRPATDADKFDLHTVSYLRAIETSNALDEFNERMRFVHELIKAEAPAIDILASLQ